MFQLAHLQGLNLAAWVGVILISVNASFFREFDAQNLMNVVRSLSRLGRRL